MVRSCLRKQTTEKRLQHCGYVSPLKRADSESMKVGKSRCACLILGNGLVRSTPRRYRCTLLPPNSNAALYLHDTDKSRCSPPLRAGVQSGKTRLWQRWKLSNYQWYVNFIKVLTDFFPRPPSERFNQHVCLLAPLSRTTFLCQWPRSLGKNNSCLKELDVFEFPKSQATSNHMLRLVWGVFCLLAFVVCHRHPWPLFPALTALPRQLRNRNDFHTPRSTRSLV